MLVNNLGYIFECRSDSSGNIGVMENFRVLFKGDTQIVTLTCAVDITGKIMIPASCNQSLGFKPLSSTCRNKEELDTFLRSNKPIFDKLGEFAMLVSGTLVFDKNTGELLSDDKLFFYIPKTVSESINEMKDNKGNQVPALICDKVDTKKGLNIFSISDTVYNAYMTNFISCLNAKDITDKRSYLCHLVLKED